MAKEYFSSWILLLMESDTSAQVFCIFAIPSLQLVNMDGENDHPGEKKAIVVGPWGGNGGTAWDDGSYSGVREITLVYARCIDSIRVVYDKNGVPVSGEKHGGVGGNTTAQIKLKFPEEFLTTVTGHCSPVVCGGSPVIRSLTFKSNRRTFGPFGVEEGVPFSFPMEGGQIVGFKGRAGWYLDAIGFHIARAKIRFIIQVI
ncbi:jacalin-related lectin 19-like [Sesamum indicum]|uniref:Jacalin-related lectin 19-like n=1 Tax=Sesamum indicum TaxID=4182 RepID=A0A8M8UNF7_SESIN|nr:jacalin-related lectin 19-like [Sesamum indicum]